MFGNANNIVSGSGYPDIKEAMRLWKMESGDVGKMTVLFMRMNIGFIQ